MASPAEWVAESLEKHYGVKRARVVNGDCVEVHRERGMPPVTVRVVNMRVDLADLDAIGLDDVHAIVTIGRHSSYSWDAKAAAFERGHDLYTNSEFGTALNSKRFVGSEKSDIEYFIDRIGTHDKVTGLERLEPRLFLVHRTGGLDSLQIYCADEYVLGEDFVTDVLDECPEAQIITNLSSWNRITPEAEEEGKRRGCPVLDLSGVYGALNRNGRDIRDR